MNYTVADGARLLSAKMKRFIEFDVLRGVLLLMMSVDHSPSSLRRFTDQPLGFFSTAECFVFVSAFLAGMLFRKRAEKLGFAAARSSSIHRAGRIYRAHLVTLSFAFILGSFFLSELLGIRNLLDRYLMNPWAAIGGSLALLFRPPLMDILPMYILFSFLTPAAFGAAQRWGWKTVLFVSFSAWIIAQTHVRDMLVNSSKDLPFVQLGPFDLLAWQLLWVGGLFIGQRFLENKALLPTPHLLRPLLVLSAIAFLFWRWISITSGTRMLAGLISLWIRPCRASLPSAAARPTPKRRNRLNSIGCPRSRSSGSPPGSSSMSIVRPSERARVRGRAAQSEASSSRRAYSCSSRSKIAGTGCSETGTTTRMPDRSLSPWPRCRTNSSSSRSVSKIYLESSITTGLPIGLLAWGVNGACRPGHVRRPAIPQAPDSATLQSSSRRTGDEQWPIPL